VNNFNKIKKLNTFIENQTEEFQRLYNNTYPIIKEKDTGVVRYIHKTYASGQYPSCSGVL
jgi:hypothetical protein